MRTKEQKTTLFVRKSKRAVLICVVHAAALLVVAGSFPSQGMADEEDSSAASDSDVAAEPAYTKHVLAQGAAPGAHCDDADTHPHDGQDTCNTEVVHKLRSPEEGSSSGNAELASKLANPSSPVLSLNFFLDTTQYSGSVPGARQSSFTITFEPTLPFPTKNNKGNFFLRPAIPAVFSQPLPEQQPDGSIALSSQSAAFGNISLDTAFGKTWPFGLMFMGGANTTFPTHSTKALRADWTFGPEIVIGYASKKTGNVWGAIVGYVWSFPDHDQTLAGQYFYSINVSDKGWALQAAPSYSYQRDSKTLLFPLGIGIAKTGPIGKLPVRVAAQVWLYTPPVDSRVGPDGIGPDWTVRFTVSPVVRRPW